MRIGQELKALRGDPASQRRIQRAMDDSFAAWCAEERTSAVIAAIGKYGDGGRLENLAALDRLMHDAETARAFAADWATHFSRALAGEQLGLIPFRHSYSPGLATIQLIASGAASLSLVTYEEKPCARAAPSAGFADRTQREIVIAGEARGFVHVRDRHSGAISSQARHWRAGDTIRLADYETSREICEVEGSFVVLQLVRTAANPRPTCEYRLEDSALLHRSCADKRASQAEMALAVLGEMRRTDAVPVMAALAESGPAHLRWESVRQSLALDPLAGAALLSSLAADSGDELQQPAARLLAQLRDKHPQLFAEEETKCLA